MKKLYPCILILLTFSLLNGCSNDDNPVPPSVSLRSGPAFTPDGAVVKVGYPITFGIVANSPDANLTNLVIKKIMRDQTIKVMFDTGMNTPSLNITKVFYQSVEEEAHWTIQVMDKNRQFATTDITIYKDSTSTWGGIFEYPSLTMGYQNCLETGQFLDPSTGDIWFSDTATLNQARVQIVTYYFVDDDLPSPTFSSPGELGGAISDYYPVINEWTIKNYTKWDISVDGDPVDPVAYDNCHNDSLIILSYDDVWGKRKFKWAEPGDIIPFLTASGKKGLIKVITTDHDAAGKITFSMKIQQ